jgi:uncharacterized protein YcnI
VKRTIGVVLGSIALVLVSALPAGAHIGVVPDEAPKGGFAVLSFSVPNEKDDASTVKLELQLPQNKALAFVSVQPKPGWTITVTKRTLDKPVKAEGAEITEVTDTITWEGGEIGPGQFDLFLISVGPLPKKGKQLTFKAIQTYSDGDEVRWIETAAKGAPEPENPAPVLKLVKAEGDHH